MISTMASMVIAFVMATPNVMIDEFLWLYRNLDKKKHNLKELSHGLRILKSLASIFQIRLL